MQVTIAKVDCTVATALCSAQVTDTTLHLYLLLLNRVTTLHVLFCSLISLDHQDVTGYPTLKFFKDGAEKEDGVKYRGNR